MGRLPSRYVAAKGDGMFLVAFPDHVRELLTNLADQLDRSLDSDADELRRLYPTAYPHDPEFDAGYQVLAREELTDGRREAIETLRRTSSATSLTEDELSAWMTVINDLRLVIGTRLDVSEDDHGIDADDPEAGLRHLYHDLGYLLSEIIDALADGLPGA